MNAILRRALGVGLEAAQRRPVAGLGDLRDGLRQEAERLLGPAQGRGAVFFSDISDRKRMEEALRKFHKADIDKWAPMIRAANIKAQ